MFLLFVLLGLTVAEEFLRPHYGSNFFVEETIDAFPEGFADKWEEVELTGYQAKQLTKEENEFIDWGDYYKTLEELVVQNHARLEIQATRTATQPHTISGVAYFGCVLLSVTQADSIERNEPGVGIVGIHSVNPRITQIVPIIVDKDTSTVKPSNDTNGWKAGISTFQSSTTEQTWTIKSEYQKTKDLGFTRDQEATLKVYLSEAFTDPIDFTSYEGVDLTGWTTASGVTFDTSHLSKAGMNAPSLLALLSLSWII